MRNLCIENDEREKNLNLTLKEIKTLNKKRRCMYLYIKSSHLSV